MNSNQTVEQAGIYYPLVKFFNEEHNLILLDSEIQEVIHEVNKFNSTHPVAGASAGVWVNESISKPHLMGMYYCRIVDNITGYVYSIEKVKFDDNEFCTWVNENTHLEWLDERASTELPISPVAADSREQSLLLSLIQCVLCNNPNNATSHQIIRLYKYYAEKNHSMLRRLHDLLNPDDQDNNFKLVQSNESPSTPLSSKGLSAEEVSKAWDAGQISGYQHSHLDEQNFLYCDANEISKEKKAYLQSYKSQPTEAPGDGWVSVGERKPEIKPFSSMSEYVLGSSDGITFFTTLVQWEESCLCWWRPDSAKPETRIKFWKPVQPNSNK